MKKIVLLFFAGSIICFSGFSQNSLLKASSLNKMMDLVMHDSVSYFKGEQKKDEYGGIYNVSTLPNMGGSPINISESPMQPFPLSFFINISTPKTTTFPRIKAELRLLIKAKSLRYNMKVKEDYQDGILALGDGVIIIQILYNEAEKKTTVSVFRQESF
jgi:hypothetical protein